MSRLARAGFWIIAATFCVSALAVGVPLGDSRSAPSEEPPATSVSVLFTGDIMLDRMIRSVRAAYGDDAVFGGVAPLLSGSDLTVGNLEGPITDAPSVSAGTNVGDQYNMRFTFPPDSARLLARYGYDLVSIGNNHILDFDDAGVASTKRFLAEAGLRFVGDPRSAAEPVVIDRNGIRLAFVAYNDFLGPPASSTEAAITRARVLGADVVIVLAHWGVEYVAAPPERVRLLARAFAEAGADLVIGTHPHVIEMEEDIGKTRVYYSLGNFVFDQYFSPEVRCGLTVRARFSKQGSAIHATYEEQRVGLLPTGSTVLGCS